MISDFIHVFAFPSSWHMAHFPPSQSNAIQGTRVYFMRLHIPVYSPDYHLFEEEPWRPKVVYKTMHDIYTCVIMDKWGGATHAVNNMKKQHENKSKDA